jgi:parallel beta-helix repeat protein
VLVHKQNSEQLSSFTRALLLGIAAMITTTLPASAAVEIDVRNFGVACNGVTDDSAAFQAALNALPASGGAILRIPCKMSLRSGVRLMGKSDVTVTASASGAGFKALSSAGVGMGAFGPLMFVLERCDRCVVENLEIDMAMQTVGGIGITASTDARISGNTIRNTGNMSGGALSGAGNVRTQYVGNTIVGTTGVTRGLWIGNAWNSALDWYPQIANNTVRNVSATGIVVHCIGATVSGNSVEWVNGAGIKSVPPPTPTGVKTIIEHNSLRNNTFDGMHLADAHDMIVRNNTLELNRGPGLYADGQLTNVRMEQNIIRNNDLDYLVRGWGGGILMHQGTNVTIVGNTIEDTRTGSARTQTNGIWVKSGQGPFNGLRIERNSIRNNSLSAVHMSGQYRIDNAALYENTFADNSSYGLAISPGVPGGTATLCNNTTTGGRGELLQNSLQVMYSCAGYTPAPSEPTPTPITPAPTTSTPFITKITPGRLRNDFQGWVGMRFRTGSTAVTVGSLGRIVLSGNSRNHTVALFTSNGQTVAGGSVTVSTSGAPAGQFRYAALSAPIVLQANTTYVLATQETAGGDYWYDCDATVTTTSVANVETGSYSWDSRSWYYAGSTGRMYGIVGFIYK